MEIPVTVGVMARAPIAGRCKTRLARTLGDQGAADLYEAMLGDRLAAVSALPVARRVILAAPENDGVAALRAFAPFDWEVIAQDGKDLGERLANAFRALATPEADRLVCLVDSDSPTLPFTRIWPHIVAERSREGVLVGPCIDGGYYLIGMRVLSLGVLEGIPWSTSGVLDATRARCESLGVPLDELAPWYDVDEQADLERVCAELERTPDVAPRTAACLARLGRPG